MCHIWLNSASSTPVLPIHMTVTLDRETTGSGPLVHVFFFTPVVMVSWLSLLREIRGILSIFQNQTTFLCRYVNISSQRKCSWPPKHYNRKKVSSLKTHILAVMYP